MHASGVAHLIVLPPGAPPRVVPLLDRETLVGAAEHCAVRLGDPDVEPVHALVKRTASGWEVSREGESLWVNARRVRQHTLSPFDLIVIGRTALSFRLGTPAPEQSALSTVLLDRLQALARRLDANDSPEAVRLQALRDVQALTAADFGAFAWLDELGEIEAVETNASDSSRLLSRTVIARVLDERRASLWLSEGTGDLSQTQSLRAAQISAVMAAPVVHEGRLAGVLYVASARPAAFNHGMLDGMMLYAGLVAHLLAGSAWRRNLQHREAETRAQLEAVRSRALVGTSPVMAALRRELDKVARTSLAVLVVGDTGTGKELVARELHDRSARASGPFVAINCGALPEHLIESTLFGHARGAFTGAHADQPGLIQAADGGTLLLDEVGELPLLQQAKLLRVLESREVQVVGATTTTPVDFRLVSATNASLELARDAGRFREDLYYRLAGVVLKLPALRERGADVVELAEYFLGRQRALLDRPRLRLSADARGAISTHPWRGNVRELQAAVARACALSDDDTIGPEALGLTLITQPGVRPLVQVRDEFLKAHVREVVEQFGGNRTAAAAALGVTPRTIFKYLEEI